MTRPGSFLLIDEPPLQVLPTLAKLIGVNRAIVLQQLHYWLKVAEKKRTLGKFYNGKWWVFNKLEDWQVDNFPFWEVKTVQRAFDYLRENGIVLAARLGDKHTDQTLYYTIDYDRLNRMLEAYEIGLSASAIAPVEEDQKEEDSPFGQNVQMGLPFGQKVQIDLDKKSISIWTKSPNVNNESETTSETTQRDGIGHPIKNIEIAWLSVSEQIKLSNKPVYNRYVKDLQVSGFTGGVVSLIAPDQESRDWVESRLCKQLTSLLSGVLMETVQINLQVRS